MKQKKESAVKPPLIVGKLKNTIEDYGIWEVRPDINRVGHRGLWIKEENIKVINRLLKEMK